jgi:hypothetical protein
MLILISDFIHSKIRHTFPNNVRVRVCVCVCGVTERLRGRGRELMQVQGMSL